MRAVSKSTGVPSCREESESPSGRSGALGRPPIRRVCKTLADFFEDGLKTSIPSLKNRGFSGKNFSQFKEDLSQVSADVLSVREKPSVRKRRVSSDVAMDVIGSNSNKRGSSNRSSRRRSGGSTRRRSSRSSEHSNDHSHDAPSNRSFEVTSELSKEPIVSIPHKWCNPINE